MFSQRTLAILLASIAAKNASARLSEPERLERRRLLSAKTEWTECMEENLTVEQCKTRIENEIQAHIIPNLSVEVIYPREPDVAADSYWKVGIPTSYKGEVLGHEADGNVRWVGVWQAANGHISNLGPWFCGGFNSIQCCDTIQASANEIDVNGNYIECYMTQLDPVPYVKADNTHGYCTWHYDKPNKKYVPVEVSYQDMKQQHSVLQTELGNNIAHLTAFARDGQTTWKKFEIVNNSCHMYGRTVPQLQSMCNDMDKALHPPNTPDGMIVFDDAMKTVVASLKTAIQEFVAATFEPEHSIKIFSGNAEGSFVTHHPKVGGKTECLPAAAS